VASDREIRPSGVDNTSIATLMSERVQAWDQRLRDFADAVLAVRDAKGTGLDRYDAYLRLRHKLAVEIAERVRPD
jgi:hypothetical protein